MALKILLADDSMTAQKLGQKILADAGHEVITVSNGAAAFKRISEHKPDLLLLDVFMPGYSGPELCEKVRAGGGLTPVLLTVGQMEHFDPAEAERVKADGVIVKPFVAKDLEDVVAKIEQKLSASAAASYPPTQKIEAQDFKDASYEEWKVTADDHAEEEPASATKGLEVPEHMASASAFGDMLGDETAEPAPPPAPAAPVEARSTVAMEPAAAMEGAADPMLEGFGAQDSPPPPPEPAHEIEFTSAPKVGEVHVGGVDPALVTDATEMASAFPTRFGVEGADVVPVGVAADHPELYDDARTAEAPAEDEAAPTVELSGAEVRRITQEIAAPAESAAGSQSLEQEMQEAFGNVPVDTTPVVEEPPPPPAVEAAPPASAPAENAPDPLLAAAMQAAMGTPAPTVTLDANTIANIVHKVTERMKPELIAEIAKELAAEAERSRKP